jgi:hypothetical protein
VRTFAALALLAFVPLVACGGPDYEALRRGECLPASAKVVGEREAAPPTVDCDSPHRYEVYAVSTIDGPRTYPGEATVDERAQHECYLTFEPNLGFDPVDLPDGMKVVYLQPTESSWNDQADRDVECLLVFDDDREGSIVKDMNT